MSLFPPKVELFAPGQVLGHYRILEKVGEGGMGEVYRARDEHLDCDVAIKVLPPGSINDESARKRLHQEARALSRLSHPNIAIVHDFDTQQGVDYLVMEYIPGRNLSEKLSMGKLPENEVVALGIQLAEGLAAAHEHGVVHSDLKPGNLRLTSDERLKILDFGLAKLRLPLTTTATTESFSEQVSIAGTLPYMAPEQLLAGKIDARTDLWSAGVVLYELATGELPFQEKVVAATADAILHHVPSAPRNYRKELSVRLEAVVLKCLEKDPKNRYQSAKELAADLRELAVTPRNNISSPTAEALLQQRRRSRYLGVALALLTVLVALGVLFFRSARSLPNRLVVTGTRQLTYLGDVTGRILTDGRRIYFTSKGKNPLRYVSVNGGEETVIPCPLSRLVLSLHITPDGSYVLLKQAYGPKGGIEAPIWLVDVNSGAARRLGDIEAQDAAFAPDGKTILVAKQRELYLTDMQGANPVKLAEAPGNVLRTRWSPDGQSLRFDVWDGVTRTLWELNRDGTLHQLFPRWKKLRSACCGEWTAEGKYYLFKGDGQYWSVNDRLGSANAEPAALTTFGPGVGSVAPNPSGNTIYVSVEQGGGQDTFKWDLMPNHIPSPLYPELKAVVLGFSRDGEWIAYSHRVPAGYELWRARAGGTEKLQLTAPFRWIFMVKYSPDGRKIAFMGLQPSPIGKQIADVFDPPGPYKIYWVSAEGGALHEIPSPISGQADPAWSPDSQSIMFGQTPEDLGGGDPTVTRHLYRYDLRTEKTTEISGSDGLFSPRSSPDGRYLSAILADWQGMSLMSMATSKWQPLTRQRPTGSPFWSPDSAWVYFNDVGDAVLWRVHVPDGRVEELGPIRLPPGYNDCNAEALTSDGVAILKCWDSRADIFALDYKEEK